jgi:glutamate-1-semialdehyde 2,1-aminomutase
VAAAEDFLSVVPGADMVKFAKNGSDATTAALKLARAVTGRDMVAVAGQPFFSTDDWFIGSTAMNAGIPDDVRAATVRFGYNDLESLRALFARYPGRIAAVFTEAATGMVAPEPGFLEGLRELCTAEGAVLVFDEMITGFRWATGGAQEAFGVVPDLSTWGKAMGNGFAMAALAGKREIMELGGLNTDAERVFLLSTTNGPEAVGLAAFRAVVQAYRTTDPVGAMRHAGERLAAGANQVIDDAGMREYVEVAGHPNCLVFLTRDPSGAPSQEYRTLFLGELLKAGVLGQSFVISAAHTDADVDQTIQAVADALPVYGKAIELGSTAGLLAGRPVAPALRPHAAPRRR